MCGLQQCVCGYSSVCVWGGGGGVQQCVGVQTDLCVWGGVQQCVGGVQTDLCVHIPNCLC